MLKLRYFSYPICFIHRYILIKWGIFLSILKCVGEPIWLLSCMCETSRHLTRIATFAHYKLFILYIHEHVACMCYCVTLSKSACAWSLVFDFKQKAVHKLRTITACNNKLLENIWLLPPKFSCMISHYH